MRLASQSFRSWTSSYTPKEETFSFGTCRLRCTEKSWAMTRFVRVSAKLYKVPNILRYWGPFKGVMSEAGQTGSGSSLRYDRDTGIVKPRAKEWSSNKVQTVSERSKRDWLSAPEQLPSNYMSNCSGAEVRGNVFKQKENLFYGATVGDFDVFEYLVPRTLF